MKKENLTGQLFGRLTVIEPSDPIGKRKRTAWLCNCSCGNNSIILSERLKSGDTRSCGCLNNEKRSQRANDMYSHNIRYTPIEASARRIWQRRYRDGNVTYEHFLKLSQQSCYYCSAKPNNIFNTANEDPKSSKRKKQIGRFCYNGLDRIDNRLPHNIDNIVSCCKYCNYAKRERTMDEFRKWVVLIYNNFGNK